MCKNCRETPCQCDIPGPFVFENGTARMILDGPPPALERAWLNNFAKKCKIGSDVMDLANSFCQLGIGDPTDADPRYVDQDLWSNENEQNFRNYNYAIWFIVRYTIGLDAMRKAIEDDLRLGDAEFGEIFQKDYGRSLLKNFLTEEPKWT